MNTPHNVNELAGEYVLGTLGPEEHAAVLERLKTDEALKAAVAYWEARLLPLTALAEPTPPRRELWARIENSIRRKQALAASPAQPRPRHTHTWWESLGLWRGLALAGLAGTLILGSLLAQRMSQTDAEPRYMVVLVAPQDKTPGWVIQARDDRQVQLIPLGSTEVPQDKALQFWTKAEGWNKPVSLGLVKPGQSVQVMLDSLPPLQNNQLFELTLEPASGSPIDRPTGPVQYIGRSVKVY